MKGTQCPVWITDLVNQVKRWEQEAPPLTEVRLTHCRWCEVPSAPVGAALNLIGHGKRRRQLRGPLEPEGSAQVVEVWVRRLWCRCCEGTMTVWPPRMVPRRYYSGSAMLMALALWSIVGLSAGETRERVNPWRHRGASVEGWASLRRWVKAAQQGRLWSKELGGAWCGAAGREEAARLVRILSGGPLHQEPGEEAHRAFGAGVLRT